MESVIAKQSENGSWFEVIGSGVKNGDEIASAPSELRNDMLLRFARNDRGRSVKRVMKSSHL